MKLTSNNVGDEQWEYRKRNTCVDQIFALTIIVELLRGIWMNLLGYIWWKLKYISASKNKVMLCERGREEIIDFAKAIQSSSTERDSVSQDRWEKMEEFLDHKYLGVNVLIKVWNR